ncbi:hypothetical protein SLEP1_g60143 [Rubroshorea leprosula]|uniref:Uncharacterized protein n=1 Tax=Rubroshorea leprosula TaxID=152421 RepID=A0AAV5MXD5_9ROSI|nr:hypothetical protein SLEP1_g60143 [Rubroshorea leprosula]
MLDLFWKLTSEKPEIRRIPHHDESNVKLHTINHANKASTSNNPEQEATTASTSSADSWEQRDRLESLQVDDAHLRQLKGKIQLAEAQRIDYRGRTPLIRSPDKKEGLSDFLRDTSRIKGFGLREAYLYSYWKDMRFVIAMLAIIGLSLWWFIVPDPVLVSPYALSSPDLPLLIKVAKDTVVERVCSDHPWMTSPCPCGEPLNNEVRMLLPFLLMRNSRLGESKGRSDYYSISNREFLLTKL